MRQRRKAASERCLARGEAREKTLAGAAPATHKVEPVVADMMGGTEWLVDAFGCDPARLRDAELLARFGDELVAGLGLVVIGAPLVHRFSGAGGVTGLYLLSESHLAWHTYPEVELCTLNLYCCRPRTALDWATLLRRALGARQVHVRAVPRGLAGAPRRAAAGSEPAGAAPELPGAVK